ncbi:uncharacterized protein LOC128194999 [Vigna angularis]|uniref:uncharacterized protein LOC128194999 n=1 Tax=Phaseolus angularis TaxID=3914 RepID=UPI0022B47469|nr:uncharacterized protein LOC128194999 [Vigna angularis]
MEMKTSMGLSRFQLVYGKTCHLPVEIEHKALWALKFLNFDPYETQNKRRRQMLELEEMRKLIKKVFNPGQQVLLFNSRLKLFPGKLKSNWSGSFIVKGVYPHGAIDLVDPVTSDPQRSWVVKCQRLKHDLREVERLSTVMKLVDP